MMCCTWWDSGICVQDCSKIDRFINRTVNLGYLQADCHTFNVLVNTAALFRYSQLIPRSPPALPPILTRRLDLRKRAHPFILPLKVIRNAFLVSYIEPCFLLFSPRFEFPSLCFSKPHILSTTIISISLSLHLHVVLLAPINSCSLHIILY